jgi:RimJ/RimL family protein N-acetyltransferase
MSIGPFETEEEFVSRFIDGFVNAQSSVACFAVIDRKKPPSSADPDGEFAGIVSYMAASAVHLSAEVGYIIILPPYQRTHVTTHAVGLMLHYALDTPEQGGLGLRRMQWLADPPNKASLNAAQRMGFQLEGILRWNKVVHDADARGKVHNGRERPEYRQQKDGGRDTAYLSLCWDDWINGKRELVDALLSR